MIMHRRRAGAAIVAIAVGAVVSACSELLGIRGDRSLAPVEGWLDGGFAIDDAGADADAAATIDPYAANARADDAVQAMLLHAWDGDYWLERPGQRATAGTAAQAWEVALDAVERHHGARFKATIQTFYDAQRGAGWSFDHHDQEMWVILALLRGYDVTRDPVYLFQARVLFQEIITAWDTTCCTGTPSKITGGIWDDRAQGQKSTAVNAGAVIAGVRLYERTQISSYLAFAEQAYAYWSSNMVDPVSSQVWDSIGPTALKRVTYTHDQGLMIGAAVALARATPHPERLAEAHRFAGFLLAQRTAPSQYGPVLSDGDAAKCQGECEGFKGIAARHLAALFAADTAHTEYRDLLARSANAVWSTRDGTGLYGVDWTAPSLNPSLGATASAAMTLAAVAAIGGAATVDPESIYDAEEGTLHALKLEASPRNFQGWGYVAGWGCASSPLRDPQHCNQAELDRQGVDLLVRAPLTGEYDLTFRYAAIVEAADGGPPIASRALSVNQGAFTVNDAPFPATQDWEQWKTATTSRVPLRAGNNSVSLAFDTARGSNGWINLDRLVVSDCPTNLAANLLQMPPEPQDWKATFAGSFSLTVTRRVCGVPVIHWENDNVPVSWIKFFPSRPPFKAKMIAGHEYVASITMSGQGMYHLDIWFGDGDVYTDSVTLSDDPYTFTLPFTYMPASEPEFQIRVDGPGRVIDVNVDMWGAAIYPK
jgi:hypothetical protein